MPTCSSNLQSPRMPGSSCSIRTAWTEFAGFGIGSRNASTWWTTMAAAPACTDGEANPDGVPASEADGHRPDDNGKERIAGGVDKVDQSHVLKAGGALVNVPADGC